MLPAVAAEGVFGWGANIFQGPPDSMGPWSEGPTPFLYFYNAAFTDTGAFKS